VNEIALLFCLDATMFGTDCRTPVKIAIFRNKPSEFSNLAKILSKSTTVSLTTN